MQTVFGLENIGNGWPPSTVCIGVFDGVHLGHQKVISTACEDAHSRGRPAVVLTFDKNPIAIVRPERCPKTILAQVLKYNKIASLGADILAIAVFDEAFSRYSPEEFVEKVLVSKLNAKSVVVGHDFRFGHNREGTPEWLSSKMPVTVVPPLQLDGRRVSSTEIRNDIEAGNVAEAARLLGGPFSLAGVVVRGNSFGRKLGFPTANITPLIEQVLPREGIYAGYARIKEDKYPAAISLGNRPAVPGAGYAIEAHLLDFEDNIYGKTIALDFVTRLRDEMNFASHELLSEQIRRDVDCARKALEAKNA